MRAESTIKLVNPSTWPPKGPTQMGPFRLETMRPRRSRLLPKLKLSVLVGIISMPTFWPD